MQVPDDVTLLLCDDNWGNIRKLPAINEKPRSGGYGIYYHFDYVGGPRNYKWINTNPITKVWEQMHLAYEHRARQVWIVNVGDLKPMEFPISFFLDYAWNPGKIGPADLKRYTEQWARQQFGNQFAKPVASILAAYTKYNGRCKPELLNERTYSLTNYNEFENVVKEYETLNQQADSLYRLIPKAYKDAYYQLVLHPVAACANLYQMYYAVALNRQYAKQGRATTNDMAARVKALFANDASISNYYNTQLAGGKWSHMMDQTHIGYTNWQEPRFNAMPPVTEIELPEAGSLGIAPEGAVDDDLRGKLSLPAFNDLTREWHFVELYNKGKAPVTYSIKARPFVKLSPMKGRIDKQKRVYISIDWKKVPAGTVATTISIEGSDGTKMDIDARLDRVEKPDVKGFIQTQPYLSINAEHYQKAISNAAYKWTALPNYGRTLCAMTVLSGTAAGQKGQQEKPRLEYNVKFIDSGNVTVSVYLAPTIDFTHDKSLRYAISIDDEQPQIQQVNAEADGKIWSKAVSENINIITTKHHLDKPGSHVVKFWAISPAIVLEKLVINTGMPLKPSYLGPPETFRK
jgi:hypothetical protein